MVPKTTTQRLSKILGAENVRRRNLENARNLVIEIACKHVHTRKLPYLIADRYKAYIDLSDESLDLIDAELDDAVEHLTSLLAPDEKI